MHSVIIPAVYKENDQHRKDRTEAGDKKHLWPSEKLTIVQLQSDIFLEKCLGR